MGKVTHVSAWVIPVYSQQKQMRLSVSATEPGSFRQAIDISLPQQSAAPDHVREKRLLLTFTSMNASRYARCEQKDDARFKNHLESAE
jgi:hypothetical protein